LTIKEQGVPSSDYYYTPSKMPGVKPAPIP
jgi:hypothetical protein